MKDINLININFYSRKFRYIVYKFGNWLKAYYITNENFMFHVSVSVELIHLGSTKILIVPYFFPNSVRYGSVYYNKTRELQKPKKNDIPALRNIF